MIATLNGAHFNIPDQLVEDYVVQFVPLRKWDNREHLNILREDILDIFDVVMQDPEALYEPEFLEEFINTLAMRQALQNIGILYDS
jgi:hypothetical protein